MANQKLQKARNLIKGRPYLLWYTKSYDKLSAASILEAVLNYGNWDDFQKLKKIFGTGYIYSLFKNIKTKKRINLRPQTENYFEKYFRKYA